MDDKILRLLAKINLEDLPTFVNTGLPTHIDMVDMVDMVDLWSPSELSTAAWYDASDLSTITEAAGAVSQLDDKSGNNQHLTQPAGAFQPATGTYTLNGLNMLYYDGTEALATYGDNFVVPASGNMSIFHVAEVFLPLANTADGMFAMLDAGGADWQLVGGVNTANFNGRAVVNELGGTNINFSPAMGIGGSIFNLEFNFDGGTINGYRTGNAVGGTTYTIKPTSPQTFILMSNRVGNALAGHGGETIIVEDVTQATREKIEGYLAWKWDFVSQLPVNHPFKNSAPTTGYNLPANLPITL